MTNLRLLLRFVFIALCAAVLDFVYTAYIVAAARNSVVPAAILSALVIICSRGQDHVYFEAKTVRGRIFVALAMACGCAVGTYVLLKAF